MNIITMLKSGLIYSIVIFSVILAVWGFCMLLDILPDNISFVLVIVFGVVCVALIIGGYDMFALVY